MASSSEGGGASGGGGGDPKSFRERRLSLAQKADPSAKGAARNRKLSVYDSESTTAQEGVNCFGSPVSTCGRMSVGGLEPVPGGSTAKINQDRALAVYPFMGEKVSSGPLHLASAALGECWWHAVEATCHPSPRSHPHPRLQPSASLARTPPPSPLALALTRRAASSVYLTGTGVLGRR